MTRVATQAILEMKLRRLTGLERDKIEAELTELLKTIEELRSILDSKQMMVNGNKRLEKKIVKETIIKFDEDVNQKQIETMNYMFNNKLKNQPIETIDRPFATKPINKIFTSTTKRFFFFILLLIIENNLCKCYIRKAIVYLFIFIYKYSKLIESSLLNFSIKRALLEQRRKEICVDFSDIL